MSKPRPGRHNTLNYFSVDVHMRSKSDIRRVGLNAGISILAFPILPILANDVVRVIDKEFQSRSFGIPYMLALFVEVILIMRGWKILFKTGLEIESFWGITFVLMIAMPPTGLLFLLCSDAIMKTVFGIMP